ncbi:hypothetical protein A0H81_02358 [Grifola frondosa]|uniref:Uncharacterized protein n=1 Tax=Grifola frondosa TaxID=5627 RepID=A0A1C7ML85_GRIFR|nr:hypothetical protein A0H81_02358 [Grifola frondosa]
MGCMATSHYPLLLKKYLASRTHMDECLVVSPMSGLSRRSDRITLPQLPHPSQDILRWYFQNFPNNSFRR